MTDMVDQAEGLRRLLHAGRTRIVAVVGFSGRVGATTVAMNLSIEMARQGRPVLLLDEHSTDAASACGTWGLSPRGSLADVARGRMDLEQAGAAAGFPGLTVLPATPYLGSFNPRSLCPNGVILVDAALDAGGQLSQLTKLADDVIVVMQPSATSITATYAGLKRLQFTHALQTFQFIVNEAADARLAQLVIANVMATSSRHLAVALRPLGWISHDILVREAARLQRCVCEAYASSTAALDVRRVAQALSQAAGPQPATAAAAAHAGGRPLAAFRAAA